MKEQVKKDKPTNTAALNPKVLAETKRHVFGLIAHLSLFVAGLVMACVLAVSSQLVPESWIIFIILAAVIATTILFRIYVRVYYDNQLIITDINVQQVTRRALFSGKRSVLGLANIEDVTIIRRCVFCYFFDYGVLNIETAGEQDNFLFPYCPQPDQYVKILMGARERYIQEHPGQVMR